MFENGLAIRVVYRLMTQMIERRIVNRAVKIGSKLRETAELWALDRKSVV